MQQQIEKLVQDLATNPVLCCSLNYPGISVEQLNSYIVENGPIVNPIFGVMHGFWIYDDYFTPFRNSVPDCCELAAEIASTVGSWATWSGTQSSTLLSKGAFIFDELTRKPTTVRTPDVAFTSYQAQRIVDNFELWKHGGRPYTPTLVVEIDYLSGEHSQLDVLDHKMRNQYFRHGVQLGWLIDPRLECRKMYEYKCNEAGEVYCVDNDQWRDLDGGDVLPGLHISKIGLEMILDW